MTSSWPGPDDGAQPEPAREQVELVTQAGVDGAPIHVRFVVSGDDAQLAGLAVGLEVHARDEIVAQQERQHVVAVDALVRRRVDLDAVVKIEQALQPVAKPDQRIERRQQGASLDARRHPRAGCQVRGALPAFDLHRHEVAGLDQLGDACLGVRRPEPEVVAQVALGRDTERHARDAQQFALRVRDRGRRRVDDALAAAPARSGRTRARSVAANAW